MIKTEKGRKYLYQWDLNQRIVIEGYPAGTEVHFANRISGLLAARKNKDEAALIVEAYEENGKVCADIPNILLQRRGALYVYIYTEEGEEAHTDHQTVLSIIPREKPSDYIYTETEVKRWENIASEWMRTTAALESNISLLESKVSALERDIAALKSSVLPGDANGDGAVDEQDLALIQQYVNRLDVEIDLAAADVDGDGEVTLNDAIRLQQYLSGVDVELLESPLAKQGAIAVTDDGEGNVTIKTASGGAVSFTDDGTGNVTIGG